MKKTLAICVFIISAIVFVNCNNSGTGTSGSDTVTTGVDTAGRMTDTSRLQADSAIKADSARPK